MLQNSREHHPYVTQIENQVIVVLCIESKQLVLIARSFIFTPKCFVVGENAFLSLYKNEKGYLSYW